MSHSPTSSGRPSISMPGTVARIWKHENIAQKVVGLGKGKLEGMCGLFVLTFCGSSELKE